MATDFNLKIMTWFVFLILLTSLVMAAQHSTRNMGG